MMKDDTVTATAILQRFRTDAQRAIEELRAAGADAKQIKDVRRVCARAEKDLEGLIVDKP